MTVEADIHAALMAQAEVMVADLGYPTLWSQKGGDKPAVEHLAVAHLPNDNARMFYGGNDPMERKGFLIITLVSDLGQYEVVTKQKAGEIAAFFPNDMKLTKNGTTVSVFSHSIKGGREVSARWETPIWVEYRGYA